MISLHWGEYTQISSTCWASATDHKISFSGALRTKFGDTVKVSRKYLNVFLELSIILATLEAIE